MTVEIEIFMRPDFLSITQIHKLKRHASGYWSAEIDINGQVSLPDGRKIVIDQRVNVRAKGQRGRRKR